MKLTERQGRQVVSQTTLNLLRGCARCFWLRFLRGIRRPSGPMPTVSIRLDRIVCAAWDSFAGQGILPPYVAPFAEGKPIKPAVEPWLDEDTGLWLTGRLDAGIDVAGITVPVDHKARGYPAKDVHEAYVLQLDVYELLLKANGYKTGGYGILVYHVLERPKNQDIGLHGIPIVVAVETVATDVERAHELMRRARIVLEQDVPPEPGTDCEFCAWIGLAGAA